MTDIESLFLTGGTGFFGKALLRHWLARAACGDAVPEVTLLSRSPQTFVVRHPEFGGLRWLRLVEGDVMHQDTLPRGLRCSHVLHAAADSTAGPKLSPIQRYDQIVDGTRNMLDFARQAGARRFLLTSSGGVYGLQPVELERIPESYSGMPDPLDPAHAYSVAKRAAEHLCALYRDAYNVETVVARCFAFIGPDLPLDVHFAIGNFIRDAVQRREIVVKGDGTPTRSYLEQGDLARWLLVMLERGRSGAAYNVGSDEAISIGDLGRLVAEIVAPGLPVRVLGQPQPDNFRNRYVPDIGLARSELGLRPTVNLRDAVASTAAAARRRSAT